jgi:L-threonylcarbamoyladenylate synthase
MNSNTPQIINRAVGVLRAGGLVAFPTETVYGLGADATNPVAVERIFAAKGRPATNPLIAHVADVNVARRFAAGWPPAAEALAGEFWPGPLTLVLPKRPGGIVPQATAGLDSVGLRSPDHPLALALLRAFDGAVAAPSANRSTHISPTTAGHVRDELGGSVDLILDGGPCRVGIESTVLDLTTPQPTILRPGGITRQQIEGVIGRVRLFGGSVDAARAAVSPGQQGVHYSPVTPAFRFERGQADVIKGWLDGRPGQSTAVLCLSDINASAEVPTTDDGRFGTISGRLHIVSMPGTPEKYASSLYATLRDWDARGIDLIIVEMPPDQPAWLAVRDRLRRATRPI